MYRKDICSKCAHSDVCEQYMNYRHDCHNYMNMDNYRKVPATGMGDMSDGYHTFNELYHHRAVLFSVICNMFPDRAWKSLKHDTGDMFEGMFIVGIETDDGQATYHYDVEPYWDMFKVKELEFAPKWDGHTPAEAIERIATLHMTGNISSWAFEGKPIHCKKCVCTHNYSLNKENSMLPAFVGQPVWHIRTLQKYLHEERKWETLGYELEEGKVSMLQQKVDKSWKIRVTINSSVSDYTIEDFNKYLFTAKYLAEAELLKREQELKND